MKRSRQYLAAFEGEERVEFRSDRKCLAVFSGRIIAVAANSATPVGPAAGTDHVKGSRPCRCHSSVSAPPWLPVAWFSPAARPWPSPAAGCTATGAGQACRGAGPASRAAGPARRPATAAGSPARRSRRHAGRLDEGLRPRPDRPTRISATRHGISAPPPTSSRPWRSLSTTSRATISASCVCCCRWACS